MKHGVTLRSVLIGLVLIPANAFWVVLTEIMWLSGQPATISLFYNVVFILVPIVAANMCVKRLRPRWALQPPEILVIYTMLCLGTAMCGVDLITILVPIMSHLHRYAPVEGRYAEIMRHLPNWLVVSDPVALESTYVGQESIYKYANWRPWLGPVAWWSAFIMALCAVMWGINLILRRQWTENEKLSYPIIQVPMILASEPERLFRNRLFWIGCLIAGSIDVVNGLHVLYPLFPKFPVVYIVNIQSFFPERPWSDMGPTWVSLYPFAIGMAFLMPTDLAFSCWFFYIFWKLQRVGAAYIGMHGMPGFPFIAEQTAGGYYAIALIALWVTRRHLVRAARMLMGRAVERETPGERGETRLAALLISGGMAFLIYFCLRAGMSLWITLAFFGLFFLISLAITRMRAELGPISHDLHHVGPQLQILRFVGSTEMPKAYPNDTVMFGFFNFFNRAYRSHPMPHGLEAFAIAERLKFSHLRYLAAMWVAIPAGILSAFWAMLWLLNKYGATQTIGPGEWFGREAWIEVDRWFTAPETSQMAPTYAILIGLVFSLGLAALRMTFRWWPLHPVGYAISGSWSMDQLWAAIMVAWLAKALLLKYGGARAYKPAVPFFVGLIIGEFMAGSFWNLYGVIMEVRVYHFWPY